MTKEIPLTRGQVAIVCDCHAHLVENHKWRADWNSHTKSFRALRSASVSERLAGAPAAIMMHSIVNGTPKGYETDHINHATLDNRCENLRTATVSENQRNRGKQTGNASGFKGVDFDKQHSKWRAKIALHSKDKHIGYFNSPEDAARAYDKVAIELHGEFANTNFPAQ